MNQETPALSIALTNVEWNVILGALGEAPFRLAQPVVAKILEAAHKADLEQKLKEKQDASDA